MSKEKVDPKDVDRKFVITATSRAHGNTYTEKDGVFFKATDLAFNTAVLDCYKRECVKLGASIQQTNSIDLLAERVAKAKERNPIKTRIPDVEQGEESARVNKPNDDF